MSSGVPYAAPLFVEPPAVPIVPQIASALYRFRQTYPQVELILREQGRDEQIENVRNHQLDIGLVRDFLPPVLPEDMVSHCLLTEDMLLALRDDHPLALRKEDPSITDLAGEPLVLYGAPNGAGFTEHFFAQCEAAGFVPRIAHEARSLATLLGLVSAGFGPTVIARSMARLHVDNVVNRRFTSPVTSSLWMIHHRTLSPPAEAFRATVLEDSPTR